jgi:cation diffusion facilitator CzcD-associated flavoprotein CzcO
MRSGAPTIDRDPNHKSKTITVIDPPVGDESSFHAGMLFRTWLSEFGQALASGQLAALGECFLEHAYWRDILAFDWHFVTHSGREAIEAAFAEGIPRAHPRDVRIAAERTPPRTERRSAQSVVEAYFDFDTDVGRGSAFVRLLIDDGTPEATPKAWLLLTALQELRGFEEQTGAARPTGLEYSRNFSGENWLDQRRKRAHYDDREPEVLIVGGGQSGLILGARLGQIGVDTLIVERNSRIGDNWRNRYHSLTLHNEVWSNSLPYLDFPTTWPGFLPKDKLAGWLESYAEFMELNTWTGTEFVGGGYDEPTGSWGIELSRSGGTRLVRPRHLVLATGSVSGLPHIPALPGIDRFEGQVIHSASFASGVPFRGKRAIVIGTGNSGHDVAQDLYSNGAAEITIVQRSPTCVVSLVPTGTLVYGLYSQGLPVDDVDMIAAAIPYEVLRETYQWLTKHTCALDADLLHSLRQVGFELDFEPDHTGFHMRYLRTGGGYYINVGCSELIAEGKVRLAHARDIARFTADGMSLRDGRCIPSDLIVLATGYENQQDAIRRKLGSQVADRVGPVWGFDDEGYMRNMWRRTGQPGLWLMGGALVEARPYSRYLALQIKAELEGLLPPRDE